MSGVFFSGFETGDYSEWLTTAGTCTVVTSPVIAGGYSSQQTSTGSNSTISRDFSGLSTVYGRCRVNVHITTNPGSLADFFVMDFNDGAANIAYIGCQISTSGVIQFYVFNQTTSTSFDFTTVFPDTTYLLELKLVVSATVGIIEWKINGAIKGTHTSQNTGTTNASKIFLRCAMPSGSAYCLFDDIYVDNASYIGSGHCIARQGTAGTPTYDAFTKNGAATAALCWSDTPFSTATNCSDSVSADAQTMLTSSFNAIQSGHGTETLNDGDIINACKVAMIAKTGLASTHSLRRRLNGADTDTSKSLTTSDAYYDDGIWTDTLTNINSSEVGVLHGTNVNSMTVEDVWLMIDFTGDLVAQIIM